MPEASSRRIARNTQLILKNEALLAKVADPVGGSYLIEAITDSIATKAWKVLQELEGAGGYRKAKSAGVIRSVLEHCGATREKAADYRRLVLTGTNRFADTAEKALDRVDRSWVGSAARVAQAFEDLRLRTERAELRGISPRIVLAEIGDAKMRGARSQFAADFLACAGLESDTRRFERAATIALSYADVIVLCSSDEQYPAIAEELMPILKERANGALVLVAGNPASAEHLRKLGIWDCVHLRSNAVEVLARLQRQIGIEG
jgi:methylmalonyl-CoA mutase